MSCPKSVARLSPLACCFFIAVAACSSSDTPEYTSVGNTPPDAGAVRTDADVADATDVDVDGGCCVVDATPVDLDKNCRSTHWVVFGCDSVCGGEDVEMCYQRPTADGGVETVITGNPHRLSTLGVGTTECSPELTNRVFAMQPCE